MDKPGQPRNSRLSGWTMAALGIGQICSWGTLFYAFPLVAEAMRAELGWAKPQLYGAATLGLGLAAVAAYPVGSMIDRGWGRAVMSVASVLAGLLFLAWSRVSDLAAFYAIFAAIGCLQAATLYEPAFAVIARRVGAGEARADIMRLTLWGGFASTVFIPLIQFLIDWHGWRGALVVLGALNIVVCGGLYFAAIDPGREQPVAAADTGEAAPLAGRRAVAWAMRQPVFWLLMVSFVAYALAFSALTFHLYPLLLERGLTAAGVVTVMAVIGPAQVAGRMLVWFLARNASIRTVGSAVVFAFPIAVAGLAFAPAQVSTLAGIAAFYGSANGIMTIVRGVAVPEMLSRDAYGAINGALVGPMHAAQAVAPLGAAWLWSASGGYDLVLTAVFAGACALVACFWAAAASARSPRA